MVYHCVVFKQCVKWLNNRLGEQCTWEMDPDCPGVEVYQSTKNARRDMLKNLCIITKA